MKISLVLLASFLITILSLDVPPESSFNTTLLSHIATPFKLEGTSKAAYFTFDNTKSPSGDIALYFAKGNGFTVEVLLFSSYADIAVSGAEYTGYKKKILLQDEKEFLFEKANTAQTKYYIIIRDRNNYFYSDYITIFNENDVAVLESNSPFQIRKFYSGKKYYFEFSGKAGETISINVVNSAQKFAHSVKVTSADGTVAIDTKESSFSQSIDCKSDTKYTMEVQSTYAIEGEAEKKNIIIYRMTGKVNYMKENEINSVTLINNKQLIYAKDINDYNNNEESAITYFIDYTMKENINIKCDVKAVENSEDAIINSLPTTNNCLHEYAGDSDTYSHFYFKKPSIKPFNDTLRYFVIIVADVDTKNQFILPKNFNIALSPRTQSIDINTLNIGDNRFNLTLVNYVPYFYKLTIPTAYTANYLIFNEAFRITNFIKGDIMAEGQTINTDRTNRRLFAFNQDTLKGYSTLIIKIFGSVQHSFLHIVKKEEPITLLSDFADLTRPNDIFSFDMANCKSGAYIVGNYETVTTSIMVQDTFYGNFQVYYKKAIDVALKLEDSVLPTVNDAKIDNILTLDTELDLIYVTCTSPGRMDLHIINSTSPNEFKENSRNDIYLIEGNDVEIALPKDVIGKKVYIEAMSPFEVDKIFVTFNGKENSITKDIPFIAFEIEPTSTDQKILVGATQNAILRIRLSTNTNTFSEISADASDVNYQFAYIKFDTSSEYTQLDVHIKGITNSFYYEIAHLTTTDPKYISLPQYSGAKDNYVDATKLTDATKTFSFTNPNGKYKAQKNYYLIIQLVNSNLNEIGKYSIQYEYKNKIPTETYDKIEPLSSTSLPPKKTFELSKDEQEDIVYVATKCGKTPKSLNINYYNDNLAQIDLTNTYTAGIIKNTYLPTQITPVYTEETETNSGIFFSFVTKSSKDAFYPNGITQYNADMSLTVGYDNATISWTKINQAEEYYIYILNKTSHDELNNLCYIYSLTPNATINENSYNFTTPGNYSVNIIAKVKNKVSFIVLYKGIDEIQIGGSTTEPHNYTWLWITLSIIVALLLIASIFICMKKRKLAHVQLPNGDQPLMGGSDQIIV